MRHWLDRLLLTLGLAADIHKAEYLPTSVPHGVSRAGARPCRDGAVSDADQCREPPAAGRSPSVRDEDEGVQDAASDVLVTGHGEVDVIDRTTTRGPTGQGVGGQMDRRHVELLLTLRTVLSAE